MTFKLEYGSKKIDSVCAESCSSRMRLFWTGLSFVLMMAALLACQTSSILADETPKPVRSLELNDGDSIVFLGDSITHQRLYTQYVENYLYTRLPHLRLKLHNAGVGGDQAWDTLQRFDEDVAAYQPKYITILIGMNDGRYTPYNEENFQRYRNDMTALLGKIKDIGAQPILMGPSMFDSQSRENIFRKQSREQNAETLLLYNSVLAYYGAWLREVAMNEGYGFVDMWTRLNDITMDQRAKDPEFTLIADGIHPGPNGQAVMALSLIDDLNLPKNVSAVQVRQAANGEWRSHVRDGELTDLEASDDQVSFTFHAKALPWVLPEDAQVGVKLASLGHRLNRETLQAVGLKPGKYKLTIDDQEVGEYSSQELTLRIELQANDKTPQYQQAAQVAELNKKRNDGPIALLRNEWRKFQGYARFKQQAEANPDDEKARENLEKASKEVEGRAERVAAFNAEAKTLEDEIFKVNQPQPRKYVLTRIKAGQ